MNYPKKRKTIHTRPTLPELLSKICDIPSDIFGGMSLEMRGRNEMLLCGCRQILDYSECRIAVEMHASAVEIKGRRLTMSSFSEGRIAVRGEIDSIDFCGGGDNAE